MDGSQEDVMVSPPEAFQQPSPPPSEPAGSTNTHITQQRNTKRMDTDEESSAPDMLSPMSAEGEKHEDGDLPVLSNTDLGSPSTGYDFSNIRVCLSQQSSSHLEDKTNMMDSLYHRLLQLTCALGAGLLVLNSLNANNTRSRSKSSMWT